MRLQAMPTLTTLLLFRAC